MALTDQEFSERASELLHEDLTKPRQTWWLSFASSNLPKGEQFLGVVIVDNVGGLIEARMQMTLNGVTSPGGEIQGFGFDPTDGPIDQVEALAKLPRLTVLSKADLEAAGMVLGNP